jgi:hypothetical protein
MASRTLVPTHRLSAPGFGRSTERNGTRREARPNQVPPPPENNKRHAYGGGGQPEALKTGQPLRLLYLSRVGSSRPKAGKAGKKGR